MLRSLIALIPVFLWCVPLQDAAADEADLILHGGKVATVDAKFSIHEAIAVKGGRVLRMGSNEEILKSRVETTEVVDLRGKLVIPGLIDSHTHAANACLTEFDHEIPTMESVKDVLNYIRARTAEVPEGE